MAPRAFERPATIAFRGEAGEQGLALDGLYVPAADSDAVGAVIAPPHPEYGGSMDNPVVTELAHACDKAGMASLRFNWRGVGASAGERSGAVEDAEADYLASLAFLADTVDGPVTACGYSFGGVAAVRAAERGRRIKRLLLVAPPAALLDFGRLQAFRGPVLIAVGENDTIADPVALEIIASKLDAGSFVSIPGTDHFFMAGLAEIGRAAHAWLTQ